MVSISGIIYQKELEGLPFFNKTTASLLIGKKGRNLDKKIDQLLKIGYLKVLKKGLYVSDPYYRLVQKNFYTEFVGNILREPSYISSEYVLSIQGLIPESVFSLTLITSKTTKTYSNFLGNFIYKNIKPELFLGFEIKQWEGKTIYIATKAKALFDYFYLRKLKNIKSAVADARINWSEFSQDDLAEFSNYIALSKSKKMLNVFSSVKDNYAKF